MTKDQKRGNREAKKPKMIKSAINEPAAIKTVSGTPTSAKVKL